MKRKSLPFRHFAFGLLLLVQMLWGHSSNAQQNSLFKGSVRGENNQLLSDVSVIVQTAQPKFSTGTKTDGSGFFSISVPAGGPYDLTFTSVGYESQTLKGYTLKSGESITVNVVIKTSSGSMDQVIVVGYGTQKKVNLTGAVGVATAKDLESRPVTSATQALQGLIPGLKITTSTGELDKNMSISIRGTGTIGSSSGAPLILIDGMEGNLNNINPQDIDNISVLKDAAASAVYGPRAPFGVILVTTKAGKKGKVSINYNNNSRFASPIGLPKSMDSYTFAIMMNTAMINDGGTPQFSDETLQKMLDFQSGKLTGGLDPSPTNPGAWNDVWSKGYANTDLYNETYKSSVYSQAHNLSASGGSDKMTYYASFNYLNQGGLLKIGDDGLKRYNITGKINTTLTDWLKFSYNSRFTRNDVWRPTAFSGNYYNYYGRQNWPNIPMYDPNGYIYAPNAINVALGGTRDVQTDEQYHQATFVIEPIKNWITNASLNYSITNMGLKEVSLPAYAHDPKGNIVDTKGTSSLTQGQETDNYLNLNIYSEYSRSIQDVHNFKIMGGFQTEQYKQKYFSVSKTGIMFPDLPEFNLTSGLLGNGTTGTVGVSGYRNNWGTAGFFGRFNYDYKSRYLLEFDAGYYGTSRFRSENRWQLSPSLLAGWVISKEKFFETAVNVVNYLKIRGSYGQLGNQNTNNWYPTYRTMTLGALSGSWLSNGTRPNTASVGGLVSSILTWEKVRSWNGGIDYAFLRNRLNGSFDYFIRYTNDMVGPAPELPSTLGISQPSTNNTDLHTRGWEFSISWKDHLKNGFNYGVSLNLSDQVTIIDNYPGNKTLALSTYIPGQHDGLIWGFETIGIAKTQGEMDKHLASLPNGGQSAIGSQWAAGDIMYRDLNGDGKISGGAGTWNDHGDLKILGDSYSHYFFGLNLNADWKGFDFSCFFQGVLKRDFWPGGNSTTANEDAGGYFWGVRGNQPQWHIRGFTAHNDYFRDKPIGLSGHEIPVNLDSYFPRVIVNNGGKNQRVQSRYMQDARYVRLKNLQLGYTVVASAWMKKAGFTKCRFFVSGENLLTFTPLFAVFDPETAFGGVGGNAYPLSKVLSFGLSLTL